MFCLLFFDDKAGSGEEELDKVPISSSGILEDRTAWDYSYGGRPTAAATRQLCAAEL